MFIWHVARTKVLRAGSHMAFDPLEFRRDPRVRFSRALGTGSGRTFTISDADSQQWATLVALNDHVDDAEVHELSPILKWRGIADEHLHLRMRPIASRGTWGGREPFAVANMEEATGPIAAITRARVKARYWRRFNTEVPPVSADLHSNPGLVAAIGIGEYPVGLQGTFSIWRDSQSLNEFAYRARPHARAIDLTNSLQWYAEEMFTRFAVASCEGTLRGVNPLAGL
jgi:hypothetical protein